MLYPVKAIIAKRPRKDGKNAINFQYCYSATHRVTVDPEVAIPAAYWNKKRQIISKNLPSEFGDSKVLNDNLSRMRKVIEALIDKGQSIDVPCLGKYVKGLFTPDLKIADVPNEVPIQLVPQKLDFFGHLDDYITFKEKKVVSPGSIRCLRDRLKAFQEHTKKKITFDALDYYFYLDFVDFLTFTYEQRRTKDKIVGLKVNTICKTIKNLRVFIRDRVRRKLIAPINMDDFKAVEEESDAVYLSLDEISRIYYLDLSKSLSLQRSRDLLVLGCLTGLRFSDFSTLSYADMRGDMLYKKTNKKDNWVVIPLTTESKHLFTKLYGHEKFQISNPVFNLNIKKIAELAGLTEQITSSYKKGTQDISHTKPKFAWVTSHTCRRSFCTNEYMQGTDVNLIMKISGHKSYRDFFRYIRCNEVYAAVQIQEVWQKRNNLYALPTPSE